MPPVLSFPPTTYQAAGQGIKALMRKVVGNDYRVAARTVQEAAAASSNEGRIMAGGGRLANLERKIAAWVLPADAFEKAFPAVQSIRQPRIVGFQVPRAVNYNKPGVALKPAEVQSGHTLQASSKSNAAAERYGRFQAWANDMVDMLVGRSPVGGKMQTFTTHDVATPKAYLPAGGNMSEMSPGQRSAFKNFGSVRVYA